MTNDAGWLPPLVGLDACKGDWDSYIEELYRIFKRDFVYSKPTFMGYDLRLKRYPIRKGKEATFWHLISEGPDEEDRLPDLRRCERLPWVRPMIENMAYPSIKAWENKRRGETRFVLWMEDADYVVILAKRSGYVLPWTAYPVAGPHQRKKMACEYARSKKLKPPT